MNATRPLTPIQEKVMYWLRAGGTVERHATIAPNGKNATTWSLFTKNGTPVSRGLNPGMVTGLERRGLIHRDGDRFTIVR